MLTKYGEFEFSYQGEKYHGKPSFKNVAKIGTPSQIIHAVNLLHKPLHQYWIARKIVECCIDKELPYFNDDEGVNRLGNRKASYEHRVFVITMAKHCIQHGISGNIKDDGLNVDSGEGGKKELLTEFDPYEFIESAIELLGLSMDEASNLSMTEYISRIKNKPWYIEARKAKGRKLTIAEQKALLDEQRAMDEKLKARN